MKALFGLSILAVLVASAFVAWVAAVALTIRIARALGWV